jgi:uncharacterized repeat protein (TIGR01451 family)
VRIGFSRWRLPTVLAGVLLALAAGALGLALTLGGASRSSAASALWSIRPTLTKTVSVDGGAAFGSSEIVPKTATYPLTLTYRLAIFGGSGIGEPKPEIHVLSLTDSTTSNIGGCQSLVGTTVPNNQTVTCTYTVSLSQPGNAALVNTARLTYGPGADFLTSSARVDFPSVSLAKSSTTTAVTAPGQVVPYSYLVKNTGSVTVTGIALGDNNVDAPPSCPGTSLPPGGSMTCSAHHTVTAAEIAAAAVVNTATVRSNEAADATATLTIKATGAPQPTTPTTTTPTTPTTTTPIPPVTSTTPATPTTPTTTTAPPTGVDVGIGKTASPAKVAVGQRVTFTEHVVNHGPAQATNVAVIDPLPTGLTPVSAATTSGSCGGGQSVRCALGTLAPGQGAVITIVALTRRPGTVVNRARVTQDQSDDDLSNNVAEATVIVAGPFKPPATAGPPSPGDGNTTTVSNGSGPHYTG